MNTKFLIRAAHVMRTSLTLGLLNNCSSGLSGLPGGLSEPPLRKFGEATPEFPKATWAPSAHLALQLRGPVTKRSTLYHVRP